MMSAPRRELTEAEMAILKVIREGYGPLNTPEEVFFDDQNEAIIFAKRPDGTSQIMANLTNLSAWRADGTIATDEELRKEWLRII